MLQLLPEDYYTWADAGYGNRNLITIEIAESDFMKYRGGASYDILDRDKFSADIARGYQTAVLLCADICKRYKWDPTKKLPSGLFLISSHDEGRQAGLSSAHVDPTHIWPSLGYSMNGFRADVKKAMTTGEIITVGSPAISYYRVRKSWKDAASQLGAYEVLGNAKAACPYGYSVFDENGKAVYSNKTKPSGTQAKDFLNLSETQAAAKILELVHDTDKSGILNSVTAAQMILESGYVKTNLAKSANNCFGMKTKLSNNDWAGSTWDGKSKITIPTKEVYNGNTVTIQADFRKYSCVEDSIKDHAAYLLGAKNGSKLRYAGLLEAKNYTQAITIIKNGGYATDPNYIPKITAIIQRFGLDKYDKAAKEEQPVANKASVSYYRVAESFANNNYQGQIGAYTDKNNALKAGEDNKLTVFNPDGTVLQDFTPKVVSYISGAQSFLNALNSMNNQLLSDIKAGKKWKYSNTKKLSGTFTEAREKRNYYCNCAKMPVWALKITGVLPSSAEGFYGKKGGTIVYKSTETRKAVENAFTITKYAGKKTINQLLKSGDIQAGDIVTYYDLNHTNVYAGDGTWYDAGHAYGGGSGEAPFKTWFGKTVYGSYKVGCVLRLKSLTPYFVQVGCYKVQANANKRKAEVEKATGFDVDIYVDTDGYHVICGKFPTQVEARNRKAKLEKDFKIKAVVKQI